MTPPVVTAGPLTIDVLFPPFTPPLVPQDGSPSPIPWFPDAFATPARLIGGYCDALNLTWHFRARRIDEAQALVNAIDWTSISW